MEKILIYIAVLLTIQIVATAVMTFWPASKKRYFKNRLKGTDKLLWDLEFNLHKNKEIKEGIRKEHDRVKETIDALNAQIASNENKPETIQILEEKKKALENDLGHMVKQLEFMEAKISGEGDGQQPSIQAQLDGTHELKKMIAAHIKTL